MESPSHHLGLEYIGLAGLQRRGKIRWRRSVLDIIARLRAAFIADYVLLGGGNAKLMKDLPDGVILGADENAIRGGIKLWNIGTATKPATTISQSVRIKNGK